MFRFKLLLTISSILLLSFSGHALIENKAETKNTFLFIENKGQIGDQFYKPRTDILFGGTDGKLVYHLKANGISYQQYRIDEWKEEPDFRNNKKIKVPSLTTIYRIDINWLNSNKNSFIEKYNPINGFNNYYNEVCPNGVTGVKAYQELLYKNIYNGIDLRWHNTNNILKYDFIVAPGADYKFIQLEIKGATALSINKNGELIIQTPLGKIIEQAPYVHQLGKELKSKWFIKNNVVSFEIENINPSLPLVIDPGVRQWGTYYGGGGNDSSLNSANDANGNTYMAGTTASNGGTGIATVGSHQAIYGGGQDNGYIVKFNSAGVRQWGTYYGGPVREFGLNCAVDANSNVYLVGHSLGNTGTQVATLGSHQPTFGGTWDAYLVKFNTNGVRQWGTYYGGPGLEHGNAVACDAAGNVYITGKTDNPSGTAIATIGSHQANFGGVEDAFLAKFNTNGIRQWGTYYGGTGTDMGRGLTVDKNNDIYLAGWTDNSVANVIATPGAHQNVYGGGSYDAFVVRFNTNGVRQWGTQYGGSGTDMGYSVAVDDNLNVYLAGKTSSSFSIANALAHQSVYGGGPNDAFLAAFDAAGVRKWGTYYGGSGDDDAWGCAVHKTGHIYIAGSTSSQAANVISTAGSHQVGFGGGTWDGYIAQFDWDGVRQWGSYYGETGDDVVYGCSTDNFFHVFITGSTDTNSGTAIASTGSHQPNHNGGWGDAFLAKFYDCPAPLAPTNTTTPSNLLFCAGAATTLNATGTGTLNWYATSTSTTSLGTGTVYVTPVLTAGTHTYYAEAKTCTVGPRTAITITVNPTPTINIIATPTTVCAGKNTTLTASGAVSYTWGLGSNNAQITVTPTTTTIFSIAATNTFGCIGNNTIQINTHPLDPVTLTPSTYTSCLTIFGGGPITLTGNPPGGTYSGPNVAGNQLNPTALGTFNPVYTYTNSVTGCTNNATTNIEVFSCLSVNEISANYNKFKISPNPSNGIYVVTCEHDNLKTIEVTDINGKIIYFISNKEKMYKIDISNYANGIYFLQIKSEKGKDSAKLIKE